MAIRNGGMFIVILDDTDRLQIFHDIKQIPVERAQLLELLDLGDIVGVTGLVRRTLRGEITVDAEELQVLSKALEPPPEKFHGLKNVDARFRHREQDLVATPRTRETLRARYKMIAAIRQFLYERGFIEAETPVLQMLAGGALARPFVTHHNTLDLPLCLRIATELHLKRLVIGGLSEKVFEIGRLFRNEGISPRHNPEFTTIELYQAYVDFTAMIEMVEAIVSHVASAGEIGSGEMGPQPARFSEGHGVRGPEMLGGRHTHRTREGPDFRNFFVGGYWGAPLSTGRRVGPRGGGPSSGGAEAQARALFLTG
jgi:lysyl-tRNA synthetase class 2